MVLPELDRECRTVPEYATAVVDRLEKASALVRENLHKAATSASNWYNNKARPKSFTPGDNVAFITPADILAGHQNGSRSIGLRAACLKSSTMPHTSFLVLIGRGPKIVHVDKLKLVNSFTGQH